MTLTSEALCFKSKFITAELARLFSQSDSEDEEFEGFSDEEEEEQRGRFSARMKNKKVESEEDSDVDTGFYSDGEDAPPPKRRSLCVALRFPTKRLSTPKQELPEKQDKNPVRRGRPPKRVAETIKCKNEEQEEEELLSQSLEKRNKNIQENKAMLAKLFADLQSVAELTPPSSLQKKQHKSQKATKKRTPQQETPQKRNPSRKARPPENFAVETEDTEQPRRRGSGRPREVDIRTLLQVDEEHAVGRQRKKRRSSKCMYTKSVDEITEEDLDNIAYHSKDKIWDKENGSSCHQCRQKTLDTKTVCRSGFCVGVKGQFCGPCLKNRYGEDVRTVLLDPTWSCPICRGVCNCSLCRKKEGRCATGTLVALARYNGHDNVHDYLKSIQEQLK
ncbi:cell division cycle-associated 7-like protein [Myripristis murdjan]|uniref:cell division cycle-associated 7-like protein n=1 Tax=Myripristis murdjan TaxID=586833 RepID=UPI001175DB65|nr:cell division cycle-associated 7-like protein [Myripristis murdjan]